MAYTVKELTEFINNNIYLSECQKKEFLNTKMNIFYVDQKSNNQIITYIDNSNESKSFGRMIRLYMLFNHFLDFDFTEKLMFSIRKNRYSDDKIYKYILKHTENHKKKHNDKNICSLYTYVFEKIALMIYLKFLQKENANNIKYLDIACGNGFKTQLFGEKLELKKGNVYGTDIEEWGPYAKEKKNMPINFKFMKDNILDFPDNEFDIISIFLSLHHINDHDIQIILNEVKRVITENGILVIIEHNVLNDYDHLIVDIEHSMNSHIYEKRADESYSRYFNWIELDLVMEKQGFYWAGGNQLTGYVGFDVRYDNPYYAMYRFKN